MSDEISLAMDDYMGGMVTGPSPTSGKPRDPDYPTFHYDGKKELDLPDEGEMTIKFRKVSSTSSVNKEGEHRYACTIEVRSVCDVEGESDDESPAHGSDKSVSDLLDSLMKKAMEDRE
jgi:hypothetical protein